MLDREQMIAEIAEFQVEEIPVSDLESIAFEYICNSLADLDENELLDRFESIFGKENR